jgi:hypothetical protein
MVQELAILKISHDTTTEEDLFLSSSQTMKELELWTKLNGVTEEGSKRDWKEKHV